MITFYSDGIEILSRGLLPPLQTLNDFYEGHSVPVNDKLSELFMQLHISEKPDEAFLLLPINTAKSPLKLVITTL